MNFFLIISTLFSLPPRLKTSCKSLNFYFLHKYFLLEGWTDWKTLIWCHRPNCDLPCFFENKCDIVILVIHGYYCYQFIDIISIITFVITVIQIITYNTLFLNQGWLASTTSPTLIIVLLVDFQAWRHCKFFFLFHIHNPS